jgi:DNA-binding Lrp family transcriptional regulator
LINALLLINAETGNETAIRELLRKIVGVEEVYLVYGAYDIVAKIKTENMDKLQEIIDNHLRRFKEIRSRTTMIIIPEKPKVIVITNERSKIIA